MPNTHAEWLFIFADSFYTQLWKLSVSLCPLHFVFVCKSHTRNALIIQFCNCCQRLSALCIWITCGIYFNYHRLRPHRSAPGPLPECRKVCSDAWEWQLNLTNPSASASALETTMMLMRAQLGVPCQLLSQLCGQSDALSQVEIRMLKCSRKSTKSFCSTRCFHLLTVLSSLC